MYSSARDTICTDTAIINELSRLFSPEFYLKKEDLEPFVSLLNGIKYEYWDNPVKFHYVIGLLHQLKLDTSTQVLEHQQLLIKNRLSYLLHDTPELLATLLDIIEDASNNRRHVLNARPVSLGHKTTKSQFSIAGNRNGGFTTKPTFVIKNNTVTLPWQPWFAHIVPKSSPMGRTVLRLQQGKNPYPFLAPRSPPSRFAGPAQRIVTPAGLLTLQPPVATTAMNLTTHQSAKHKEEFGYSRKVYKQVPSSLQHPPVPTCQDTTVLQESLSESNKQALLKKQQEFLRQLDLLKADQKSGPGCNKQLFPTYGSSKAVPNNLGDNWSMHLIKGASNCPQTTTLTRSANTTIRMVTRQSSSDYRSQIQQDTVSKRRSPRSKQKNESSPSSNVTPSSKNKTEKVGEEKGLLLSRVSDHCIVISVPNQKSSKVTSKFTLQKTSPKIEKKKKHKKKKKHSKSINEHDCIKSTGNDKAFNKVKKLHKKRNKAWLKMVAQQKEKLAEEKELDHKEISEDNKGTIKISSKLFKAKHTLNKNNSCSAVEPVEMKTPHKHKCNDKLCVDAANFSSLLSPSCYVSLKKMKLDPDGDVRLQNKSHFQYNVDSGRSFPYNQHLHIPVQSHVDPDELASSQESTMSCQVSDLDHTYSADGEDSQESASVAYSQNDYQSFSDFNMYSSNIPIQGSAVNSIEGLSYVTSSNSFLQRLLITPSPPKSIQKRKRVKQKPAVSKVRKSKRQKRKRRRKEKQDKAPCKEEELVNVCT